MSLARQQRVLESQHLGLTHLDVEFQNARRAKKSNFAGSKNCLQAADSVCTVGGIARAHLAINLEQASTAWLMRVLLQGAVKSLRADVVTLG